jgi:hypothetical protein
MPILMTPPKKIMCGRLQQFYESVVDWQNRVGPGIMCFVRSTPTGATKANEDDMNTDMDQTQSQKNGDGRWDDPTAVAAKKQSRGVPWVSTPRSHTQINMVRNLNDAHVLDHPARSSRLGVVR